MSPASARALRRRRVAELRAAEPDLSLRQMADRLGISRDTVTRDLEEIDRAAADSAPPTDEPVRPVDDSAPQASAGDSPVSVTPAAEDAPPAEPVQAAGPDRPAETAPTALPRRTPAEEVVIDLGQWPSLRRDLAVLASAGLSHQEAIAQAVNVLAAGYRQGITRQRIQPGPFVVRDVIVGPLLPDQFRPRKPTVPERA
ncbi:HTH domain-containing protein [Streptomyces sp. NPDC051051]|uniref:HTH domain-containing protein n=1 Tax=Streptomyces sp. NPDC051051 TaxID=3155666 RepID=UPI00341F09FB